MTTPLLATKLYIPPFRSQLVARARLVEQLNAGWHQKLTLISAAAGFGKTTLVSEWVAQCEAPVAWLSLDEGDSDPKRFLSYFIAALQSIVPNLGDNILGILQSSQAPPNETVLTLLVNELTAISEDVVLVLDDYHVVDAKPVDDILVFLLDHLPPQLHLVIATREDPPLPLARLRVRGQLTELRVNDLRFTVAEATDFLNQVMDLNLGQDDVVALEARTEGWIAGLHLAALSLQGHPDATNFIQSFTGSHHFVLDYLVEEVLQRQSAEVQNFLLKTSILDRLCGSLCDAVVLADKTLNGQETLYFLEQANLFLIPLDNERRWYRYHHLFGDLLRQRLQHSTVSGETTVSVAELHIRASAWYEEHGFEIDAFHHATVAHDVERATRLIEGKGMPLHFREGVRPVLNWLNSLPKTILDEYPVLWTNYASVLLVTGQVTHCEHALQSAEAALEGVELDEQTRDTVGRIAAIRSTIAATLKQVDKIITESQRALEYLHPDNLAFRTATAWKLGYAYHLRGDRVAATQAYKEVIAIGEKSKNLIFTIMATLGLARLHQSDNQLHFARETYQGVLDLLGTHPLPVASEAHFGLAEIYYEWNDLDRAEKHIQEGLQLSQTFEYSDRIVEYKNFSARLQLVQGDIEGALANLSRAEQIVNQYQFTHQLPAIVTTKARAFLQQADIERAVASIELYQLPLIEARIHLAQDNTDHALDILADYREQMETRGWANEILKSMILQSVAFYEADELDTALQILSEALALTEAEGFVRLFLDEGLPMTELLQEAHAQGIRVDYVAKLLSIFEDELDNVSTYTSLNQPLIEPLSERELEVLHLIANGLSNNEIGERLFLALSTVKGHNRRIFDKLQVQRRTEAVARARELGLL